MRILSLMVILMAILTVVSAQNVETTTTATAGITNMKVEGTFGWVEPMTIVVSSATEAKMLLKAGETEKTLTLLAENDVKIIGYLEAGFNAASLEKALLDFDQKTETYVNALANVRKNIQTPATSHSHTNFLFKNTKHKPETINSTAKYYVALLEISRRYIVSAKGWNEYNKLSESEPLRLTDEEMGRVFAPAPKPVPPPKYHEPTPK